MDDLLDTIRSTSFASYLYIISRCITKLH